MYTIVFIEPENAGNIGAIARVMKNFGLKELVLVNPKCEIDKKTEGRAKHALDVVERMRVVKDFKSIGKFDYVVGTTGKIIREYSEVRHSITPRELKERLNGKNIALVFGREGIGLTNEELSACDIAVHIPTDDRYPVMNVSHAAAIIFYELFSADAKTVTAGRKEREVIFKHLDSILPELDGLHNKKKVSKIFRNVFNRSMMAEKEAGAIAGTLNEIKKKLTR